MIAPSRCPSVAELHERFLDLLPRIELHGRIFFRHLRQQRKEESIQEMRALAWKWFVRLARRGKYPADFLMTFNTFLARAVNNGRRVVGMEKAKDVMCRQTQQRHGFQVESLPMSTRTSHQELYSMMHGQQLHDVYEERLRDNSQTPIPDQAAFRVDFPAWLATITQRDRQLVEDLALSHRTLDLADKYGLSPSRISQKRRQFQDEWERFCGERDTVAA
jgi:hypothetical protein